MSKIEFEQLRNLLEQENVKVKPGVNSKYFCLICGNILIDSQIAICGCRYCKNCIIKYIESGQQFCPGKKDECIKNRLSIIENISPDHLLNRKIPMLIGICPEEMCLYECELKNMTEHLRVCMKKNSSCPFYEFGCKLKDISEDEMVTHFQRNCENHNKIIIDVINNFSNEIKRIEENNFNKINELQENLKNKNEKLESFQQFFDSKLEQLEKQIKDDKEEKTEAINKLLKENLYLKSELENSKEEIDHLKVELKLAGSKLLSETGLLVWKIDGLFEKRTNKSVLSSDYFYSIDGHKFTLYLYCSGCSKTIETDHLSIKLCLSNYQCNQSCFCCCNVFLEIIDQTTGDPFHEMKQINVNIHKGKSSLPFHFLYSNLSPDGILKNNSIIIKCRISC